LESLALGAALGLVAGLIPGAYSTLVATTALERGMAPGLKVALIPIATEIPVLLAAVFVLTQLPEDAFRWIGVVGGILLIFVAWKVLRDAESGDPVSAAGQRHRGHFLRAALFGLLSPGPWVFWFFLGAPLLLGRWRVGALHGLLFLAAFMICFIGVMLLLAWGVATGRRFLNLTWYRRTLRGAGALLVVAGAVLIWQSWVGNFTAMVQAPDRIEEELRPPDRSGAGPSPPTTPPRS
jgi:threonine/homoserine/homoserine lactone efflux protein